MVNSKTTIPAGYSGTPLAKKLGLKENFRVWLINQPHHYFSLFADLPHFQLLKRKSKQVDFIHLFCTHQKELVKLYPAAKSALAIDGMLWVSWPKKTSALPSDLNRDWIRDYILPRGLVDVKVCAVDEDWSGLKFVYRTKDR